MDISCKVLESTGDVHRHSPDIEIRVSVGSRMKKVLVIVTIIAMTLASLFLVSCGGADTRLKHYNEEYEKVVEQLKESKKNKEGAAKESQLDKKTSLLLKATAAKSEAL